MRARTASLFSARRIQIGIFSYLHARHPDSTDTMDYL